MDGSSTKKLLMDELNELYLLIDGLDWIELDFLRNF